MDELLLQKGESIQFLDYTIKNSLNNDGLVLFKDGGKLYETHLGNYGTGTSENVMVCKRYALLYFMCARPEEFSTNLVRYAHGGGTYMEYFTLKKVCERENIELPSEVGHTDINFCITFNGVELSTLGLLKR